VAKMLGSGDRVTFLGLGHMGFHMANAIANAGYSVVGWSRRPKAFEGEPKFKFEPGLDRAIDGADAIVVCVRDHVAVEDLLFKSRIFEQIAPGGLVIDMGTSGPQTAIRHGRMFSERSVSYLDAPVSGGTQGAKDGTLSIFVGGSPDDYAAAAGLLSAMGRPSYLGRHGSGQIAKLANQIIVGVTIAAVAEGLAFAEAGGLEPLEFLAALDGGFASSRILALHGPRMAARDYSAAGAVKLHLKDLTLGLQDSILSDLPHAQLVKSGFEQLEASGAGVLDHSAYAALYQGRGAY